jgi:hypothetical protein
LQLGEQVVEVGEQEARKSPADVTNVLLNGCMAVACAVRNGERTANEGPKQNGFGGRVTLLPIPSMARQSSVFAPAFRVWMREFS